MAQLLIDLTPEEHEALSISAAREKLPIEAYIKKQALAAEPLIGEDEAWDELDAFLAERVREAEAGAFSNKTVEQIFAEARLRHNAQSKS